MAQIDVNHPPTGGFQNGAWYWDPVAGAARQAWNGKLGAPSIINNPNQIGFGKPTSSGGSVAPTVSNNQNPLEQVNSAIQNSFQKLQNDVVQKFGQYQAGKPFKIDEVLADKRASAKEQIDPYYDQLLGDYLTGVTRKINRGVDDTRDLLNELNTSSNQYLQDSTINQDNSINTAQNSYAENGLSGSGDALNAEGQIKQNTNENNATMLRKTAAQTKNLTTGLARNTQDINTDKTNYVTNLEQNRSTDINTRAGSLAKEAGQQYVQGFQQTLPTELQSASGFDMLKSLGIYS
jgi:hypothetical protein